LRASIAASTSFEKTGPLMTQIPLDSLGRFGLFEGMSPAEVGSVAEACTEVNFAAGELILIEGQVARALWLLIEGKVEVDLHVAGAGERIIAELSAPSIFGESSFFHAHPHSASVKTLSPTRLLKLDRSRFEQLAAENNIAALRLGVKAAELLAGRLYQTDRFVEQILQSQMDRKVHAAWRHLREGLGQGPESAAPFIGLGANWK
jgi:CRP-like cAMP-binding protein